MKIDLIFQIIKEKLGSEKSGNFYFQVPKKFAYLSWGRGSDKDACGREIPFEQIFMFFQFVAKKGKRDVKLTR